MKQRQLWTVTVSNLGMIYSGFSESKARKTFDEYKEHVAAPRGRVSGETVALFRNDDAHGMGYGDVVAEYTNEFQSFRQGTRQENPMKTFRPPFHVDFHSERGEVSIHVTDADDNEVWYADTDMVNELVEDGFLDTHGFIMGRNARPDVLEKSVLSYLRSVGIIADRSEKPSRHASLPTTVYDDARDLYDENPSRAMGHFRKGFGELRGDFDAALEAVRRRNREENPCGHRRNPGDVHIDIQSHNTRGSHVRAKNPVRKLWVIQWFNEDHPVEPMWMERTSFEGTHDEAMETLNILQKNQPHIEFRLAEDRLRSRRENPTREDVDGWIDHYRNVRAKNPAHVDAEHFHPMRGHVDEGVSVRMADGTIATVKNLMRGWVLMDASGREMTSPVRDAHLFTREVLDANDRIRSRMRHHNPTREDVDGWIDHYRTSMEKRIDGVPERAHYVVKIVTKDGQDAWLRVGKGTKFDTDPSKARVYRNGDKANEAATKVANWLKKKQPAKWKKIATISAEPKK